MKQIVIVLLLIILGIMGYNLYKKYQRFNPPNYEYQSSEDVNPNHSNKGLLLDYYQAIEAVNGYVITQWSAHSIDVRNPEDDDGQTLAAVSEYNRKMGEVKFYEEQLLKAMEEKPKGKKELSEAEKRKKLIQKMFYSNPVNNSLRLGETGALVYEIQGILIQKGNSIKHDGLFRTETFNALKSFEEKNGLLPDGKLDAITLEYLLN